MRHHPRKRFGQHFLKNHNIIEKIIDCLSLKSADRVIEIGPGLGALTSALLKKLNHLDVIEIDRDLIAILQKNFHEKSIAIHAADALSIQFETWATKQRDLRIVGNLPYNIATPLLFKLFDEIAYIQDMHFMLQKEVVLRLTAKAGSEHYSRLSVMSQYFCNNEYLFTVPPTVFDPPPAVYSAVVRLTPKINQPAANDLTLFSTVVREAFCYRRKQLSNALKQLISINQLTALQIDPGARPETLTVDEFVKIANSLTK